MATFGMRVDLCRLGSIRRLVLRRERSAFSAVHSLFMADSIDPLQLSPVVSPVPAAPLAPINPAIPGVQLNDTYGILLVGPYYLVGDSLVSDSIAHVMAGIVIGNIIGTWCVLHVPPG